jgi:5'-nucleotidase
VNLHSQAQPVGLGEEGQAEPGRAQLLLPLPGVYEHPAPSLTIPRADRVFANRNLRMGTIDWVGFDMDYTLAIYRQAAMDALSIHLMAERLVARGYPEFLRDLEFDTAFPIRGLVVDTKFGNILKMDRHKLVSKGYHGTKVLSREETERLYLQRKVKAHTRRYHWIDTLFALCEVTAYAALVTALEERSVRFDPRKLFEDVRASIDLAHADGSVYRSVLANIEQYIERDPALAGTLHRLRSSGKRLFLLTNSPFHYTNAVMSYLLDGQDGQYPKWRNYFDVVICAAKKPAWFAEGTELKVRVSGQEKTAPAEQPHDGPLEKGKVYEGGGLKDFERRLGIQGSRVLYVGDHIYGDILRSKKDSTWRTAMIIQELDREVEALEKTALARIRRRQLYETHPLLEDELRYFAAQLKAAYRADPPQERQIGEAKEGLERRRTQLADLEGAYDAVEQEIDHAFHPYFGSLLKELNGLSIFGQQVDLYADVYMRRVSCLGEYSPTQFFRSPHDLMPHEI